jgi:hypothetical protein
MLPQTTTNFLKNGDFYAFNPTKCKKIKNSEKKTQLRKPVKKAKLRKNEKKAQ